MTAAKKSAPADKDKLLAPRLPEDTVEIPGMGTVRVRGLSRGEFYALRKVTSDELDYDSKVLARCMLEPAMNEDEVRQWIRSAPAGEHSPVFSKINELSGIGQGADKSDLPEVRGES